MSMLKDYCFLMVFLSLSLLQIFSKLILTLCPDFEMFWIVKVGGLWLIFSVKIFLKPEKLCLKIFVERSFSNSNDSLLSQYFHLFVILLICHLIFGILSLCSLMIFLNLYYFIKILPSNFVSYSIFIPTFANFYQIWSPLIFFYHSNLILYFKECNLAWLHIFYLVLWIDQNYSLFYFIFYLYQFIFLMIEIHCPHCFLPKFYLFNLISLVLYFYFMIWKKSICYEDPKLICFLIIFFQQFYFQIFPQNHS